MEKSIYLSILFIFGLFALAGCSANNTKEKVDNNEPAFTGDVKEFRVEAFRYGYEPNVIEVNRGDKVRIIGSSRDVPHGLALPEYGVNLYLDGLSEDTAEFIADKPGEFTFYCSVPCGSGHSNMKGKLIVK